MLRGNRLARGNWHAALGRLRKRRDQRDCDSDGGMRRKILLTVAAWRMRRGSRSLHCAAVTGGAFTIPLGQVHSKEGGFSYAYALQSVGICWRPSSESAPVEGR